MGITGLGFFMGVSGTLSRSPVLRSLPVADVMVLLHDAIIGTSTTPEIMKTLAITEVEVRKMRHDPSELLTRAVQPALWLLIFGQVLARVRAIPSGGVDYLDYLANLDLA